MLLAAQGRRDAPKFSIQPDQERDALAAWHALGR